MRSRTRARVFMSMLPAKEKVGHRRRLHAAHGLEFPGLLTVDEPAVHAEDGESRYSLVHGNLVVHGDIQILVHASDVDVHQDVVGVQDGLVGRIMKVKIENAAIGAPIAAEVQDDTLVTCARGREGGGQVAARPAGSRVYVAFLGMHVDRRGGGGQGGQNPVCTRVSHPKTIPSTQPRFNRRLHPARPTSVYPSRRMRQSAFALLLVVMVFGSLAHAADPQPYRVNIASVGDDDIDATLKATSDLQSLRGTAPVSPFGLIARARSDVDRLKTVLESFGYYQSSVAIQINGMLVGSPDLGDALQALPKDTDAQVQIGFTLGPLYHLGRIDIDGDL